MRGRMPLRQRTRAVTLTPYRVGGVADNIFSQASRFAGGELDYHGLEARLARVDVRFVPLNSIEIHHTSLVLAETLRSPSSTRELM